MDFDIKVEENPEESTVVVLDAKEIRKIKNDNLKKALARYKKGGISFNKVAKQYSVSKNTLFKHFHGGRCELMKKGRKLALPLEIEQQLVEWMIQGQRFGNYLTRKNLQKSALFLTKNCKNLDKQFSGSTKWASSFTTRNDIQIRSKRIDSRAWFYTVNRDLETAGLDSILLDPSRVWRCDQVLLHINKGGNLEANSSKADTKQGLFFFSAHGETLKPHLIEKGVPRRLKVAGVTAATTEDGNVTHEEFARYLEEDFAPQLQLLGVQFPIVLFLSPETTHDHIQVWQTAKQLGINLVTLHPDFVKAYEKDDTNILKELVPSWEQIRHSSLESTKLRSNCGNLAFILNQLTPICFTKSKIQLSFEVLGLFPWLPSTNQDSVKMEPPLEIDQMNDVVEVTLERPFEFKCRACRREGDEDFVSMDEDGLSDVFKDLTGIVVDEESSSFVCMKCKIKLESFAYFRRLCLSSQEAFETEKEDELNINRVNMVEKIETQSTPKFVLSVQGVTNKKQPKRPFHVKKLDKVICNDCAKLYERQMFFYHWFYTHKVDPEPSICTECSKSLPSIYQLEQHLRKKHGILKCITCNRIDYIGSRPHACKNHQLHLRRCRKRVSLNRHKQSPIRELAPYNCTLCSKGYCKKADLRNHYERTHNIVYEKGQYMPVRKGEINIAGVEEATNDSKASVLNDYAEENMLFD